MLRLLFLSVEPRMLRKRCRGLQQQHHTMTIINISLIAVVIDSYCLLILMMLTLMLDVAVCLMCLMRLLMWLLAHAVDGGVDMDGCFVLALCFFWRTN